MFLDKQNFLTLVLSLFLVVRREKDLWNVKIAQQKIVLILTKSKSVVCMTDRDNERLSDRNRNLLYSNRPMDQISYRAILLYLFSVSISSAIWNLWKSCNANRIRYCSVFHFTVNLNLYKYTFMISSDVSALISFYKNCTIV